MPSRSSLSDCRAVLFDVDGTLVDSIDAVVRGISDTFFAYFGERPADPEIRSRIGTPLREHFLHHRPDRLSEEELEELHHFAVRRFESYAGLGQLFAPAVEALRLCHESGMRTALVTSKSADELAAFLPRFSGARWVDTTVCASDVSRPKPEPDSARLACERLSVSPGEAILIGDSVFDLRCARSAGCGAIAVAYGAAPRTQLEAEKPDALLDTPEALLSWICEALPLTPCAARS